MRYVLPLLLLLVAAGFEAGGDAVVRLGLHADAMTRRVMFLLSGGLLLFAYGCIVNAAPWDFGKLLGVYVVFFFVVAQAIAWFAFGQAPSRGIWIGGALIVIGGAIVAISAK